MNRRGLFKRLAAIGIAVAGPEIVRRFWPEWAEPTFEKRASLARAEDARSFGVPDPGEPLEWDVFYDFVTSKAWLYRGGRWHPVGDLEGLIYVGGG